MRPNKLPRILSIIGWLGGKGSLLDEIIPRFPLKYLRYVDVFGGSGVVLLNKKQTKFEVYNDYQKDLVNLQQVIKEKPLQFLAELNILPIQSRVEFEIIKKIMTGDFNDLTKDDEELEVAERLLEPLHYEEVREIIFEKAKMHDVKRAVNFYKLIKLSYASAGRSFQGTPVSINPIKLHKDIQIISRRLEKVILENKDFEDLIKQYDRKNSFFYCDPPYFLAEDVYNADYGTLDHQRLFDVLSNIQGKFLLSYNDCEYIRELYKDYEIIEVKRIDNLKQRYEAGSVYHELLIANYDIKSNKRSYQLKLWSDKDE